MESPLSPFQLNSAGEIGQKDVNPTTVEGGQRSESVSSILVSSASILKNAAILLEVVNKVKQSQTQGPSQEHSPMSRSTDEDSSRDGIGESRDFFSRNRNSSLSRLSVRVLGCERLLEKLNVAVSTGFEKQNSLAKKGNGGERVLYIGIGALISATAVTAFLKWR